MTSSLHCEPYVLMFSENEIVGKIKSSTAENLDDWTKIKSQDECSSLSENNTPQGMNIC